MDPGGREVVVISHTGLAGEEKEERNIEIPKQDQREGQWLCHGGENLYHGFFLRAEILFSFI